MQDKFLREDSSFKINPIVLDIVASHTPISSMYSTRTALTFHVARNGEYTYMRGQLNSSSSLDGASPKGSAI